MCSSCLDADDAKTVELAAERPSEARKTQMSKKKEQDEKNSREKGSVESPCIHWDLRIHQNVGSRSKTFDGTCAVAQSEFVLVEATCAEFAAMKSSMLSP